MSKKITILPQIKKIKSLTPTEKKVASEIARFTNQDKWFFKDLNNFASELEVSKGTLKNAYVKLTKLEWLEKDRNGKYFDYKMTQKFFNFVANYESNNSHIFAHFSKETMTDKLPNNDRLMTDKLPNNDQSVIKITFPSSVEATNQPSNILNNECIKDLNNEMVKPLSPRPTATLSKLEILKQEIQANPLYPKIISLYPKIPSERLETEIEFALTKYIELGRTSGAFSYIKSYLSNADFKDVLTNKKLEIEDEINSRRKTAYEQKASQNSSQITTTSQIEVDPNDFQTQNDFAKFTQKLDAEGKSYKVLRINFTRQRIWDEATEANEKAPVATPAPQKSEAKTPMEIMMEAMKKSNPQLAQQMERGAKNPSINIAQKLVQN
jgi:hypothetical protein